MTKDKLKEDVIRTIYCLNSDISNKDRELLIKLFKSIIDYINNTELEQEIGRLQQKYNELTEDINNTLKPKINSINDRVTALENASQS